MGKQAQLKHICTVAKRQPNAQLLEPYTPSDPAFQVAQLLRDQPSPLEQRRRWIDDPAIQLGVLRIDISRHAAFHNSKRFDLTLTQFRLLECLIRNVGTIIRRDQPGSASTVRQDSKPAFWHR